MKIGFDAKRLYSNMSGLGNYSRTLLRNLSSYLPANDYVLYTTKITLNKETNSFLEDSGYTTTLSRSYLKSLWRSFGVVSQLKKDNIELFHGLSHEIPFGIQKSGIKTVVTIHDLIFKIYPEFYPFADRLFYNIKIKNSLNHADRIIAISESTKKDIIRFYNISPDKIDVIYQPCDPIYYDDGMSLSDFHRKSQYKLPDKYLLSVGSIEKRKNLECILKAYRYLPEKLKLPIVIIGKGSMHKNHLMRLCQNENISHLVYWREQVDDKLHLKKIYQSADALLYPSLYEGFGLPVVEALLSRTPVITSNTSSLAEAGGPDTMYIDPLNHEGLAEAIKKLLTNKELRVRMKEKGYTFAMSRFNPEIITKKLGSLYFNIANDL